MEELKLNTEKMTQYSKDEGYHVIEMRVCQWRNKRKHENVKTFVDERSNTWRRCNRGRFSEQFIIQATSRGDIFEMVERDIEAPENSRSQFQEMPPISKNFHVSRDDIGEITKA